jgi:pimeloyl-ACP methyl ester carboxylesterase
MQSLALIPGLLCDHRLWRNQIATLARYAEVVVADITRHQTISEMADAILQTSPPRFSIAGFSLGSQVALEIVRRSADRIERLALLSATRGGLLHAAESAIRNAVSIIESGGFDQYLEAAYPTYVGDSHIHDAALKLCFMNMAHTVGPVAGLRQMRALLAITSPFVNLDQIECPTIIIGGREDRRTTPGAHEPLAKEIPGSTLVIIDNAAHFTPLEQPETVSDVMRRWMAE